MNVAQLTLDGLWKSLCPSFHLVAFRATLANALPRGSVGLCGGRGAATVGRHPVRALHATRNSRNAPAAAEGQQKRTDQMQFSDQKLDAMTIDETITAQDLVQSQGAYPELQSASTKVIKEAVAELSSRRGQYVKIQAFMQHLLEDRGEPRTAHTYEVLMASNFDKLGSAAEVRLLLKAMSNDGIEKTSRIYHDALWVLAIHPDYLMRNRVLDAMRRSWTSLLEDGELAIAIGLLRDGQFELAVDSLEDMTREQIDVPAWIWDIFIFQLGKLGYVDDALKLMTLRLSVVGDLNAVSLNTWYYLLDICSKNLHYAGTKLIWGRFVKSGLLNPPDGMVHNVLMTAARARDADLATQAIMCLSGRGVKLGHHHYEALVDCYAQSGDVQNAFQALAVMAKAGLEPDRACTRSIYACLRHSPSEAAKAYEALFEARNKTEMPIAALNVVCEVLYEQDKVPKAQDLYRHVRDICPAGPNAETFRVLLSRPIQAEIAKFVASEMSAFSIRPDSAAYDSLVRSFVKDGSLDDAFWYLGAMNRALDEGKLRSGTGVGWLAFDTVVELIKRCVEEEDSRIWTVVDQAGSRGMELDGLLATFFSCKGKDGGVKRGE